MAYSVTHGLSLGQFLLHSTFTTTHGYYRSHNNVGRVLYRVATLQNFANNLCTDNLCTEKALKL